MPHKFPLMLLRDEPLRFAIPFGGRTKILELSRKGIVDVTPPSGLAKFEERIRTFEVGDLNPFGDLIARGLHANVDILIEETARGAAEFSRGLVSIARGTGGFTRG